MIDNLTSKVFVEFVPQSRNHHHHVGRKLESGAAAFGSELQPKYHPDKHAGPDGPRRGIPSYPALSRRLCWVRRSHYSFRSIDASILIIA